MKITSIDIFELDCTGAATKWRPVGVRVHTDEGIYGDGEAAMAYGVGASGAFGMAKDFAELVIGMDPLDNELIWEKIYKTTFWGQNGGPAIYAGMAAIDTALWDIKGKALNLPLYKLLGGKRRDKLRTYASQIQYGFDGNFKACSTPEDYAEVALHCVNDLHYDAVKVDFLTFDENKKMLTMEDRKGLLSPRILSMAHDRVAAVREAVGPNVDILVENHSNLDALSALQFAKAIEKYNIFFFEEPNTPTPKTGKYISENTSIPIANGERIYTRWQFLPYFEQMSIQVAQPDIGNCGGITEAKKICDLAYVYDVSVQAHVCGSPLSIAASLQLEAAIPNFCIHEHHRTFLRDFNKKLCIYDYQPENGYMSIPDLPGLGNEFAPDAIKNATVKVTVK